MKGRSHGLGGLLGSPNFTRHHYEEHIRCLLRAFQNLAAWATMNPLPEPQLQMLLSRLGAMREKLIDHSLRNRALNYKDSGGKNLKLSKVDLDTLYDKLVSSETELHLQGTPAADLTEAEVDLDDENEQLPAQVATALDLTGEDATIDLLFGTLRCRLKPQDCDRRIGTLLNDYRTGMESTGANFFYLALGFLEWRDPAQKDSGALYAPLLFIPVELKKSLTHADNGHAGAPRVYRYTIKYDQEDILDNTTLRLKLKEYGVWPAYSADEDENESFGSYAKKVESFIEALPVHVAGSWKIVRAARLGFFSPGAMYNDLNPDRWANTRLVGNEWVRALLEERDPPHFAGFHDKQVTQMMHGRDIRTVVAADSSQMRALMQIHDKHSIVIQGPPGTGKSQTITNVIASALATGKKVLFVAEKLPALTVVSSRLKQAGLAPYCLELHSSKITSKELLAQAKTRLAHQPAAIQPPADTQLQVLQSHLSRLQEYGETLGASLECTNVLLYEAIWRESASKDAVESAAPGIAEDVPPLVESALPTLAQLEILKEQVREASRFVAEGVLDAMWAWHGTCPRNPPTEGTLNEIRVILQASRLAAEQWHGNLNSIPGNSEWNLDSQAHAQLEWAASFRPPALAPVPGIVASRLSAEPSVADEYLGYLADMREWRALGEAEAVRISELETITTEEIQLAKAAAAQLQTGQFAPMAQGTFEDFCTQVGLIESALHAVKQREQALVRLAAYFMSQIQPSLWSSGDLWANLALQLAAMPPSAWQMMSQSMLQPWAEDEFNQARGTSENLKDQQMALAEILDLARLPEDSVLNTQILELREAEGGWFNWFPGTRGAKARKAFKRLTTSRKRLNDSERIKYLSEAITWRDQKEAFRLNAATQGALGIGFNGIETAWRELGMAFSAVRAIRDTLGLARASSLILNHDNLAAHGALLAELGDRIKDETAKAETHLPKILRLPWQELRELSVNTVLQGVSSFWQQVHETKGHLSKLEAGGQIHLSGLPRICQNALQLRSLKDAIFNRVSDPAFLGPLHTSLLTTDLDSIEPGIRWAVYVAKHALLPTATKTWVLEADQSQRADALKKALEDVRNAIRNWQWAIRPLSQHCKISQGGTGLSPDYLERSQGEVAKAIATAFDSLPHLAAWFHFCENEREIAYQQGGQFWSWLKGKRLPPPIACHCVELAFWKQHLQLFETQNPGWFDFHHAQMEARRAKFKEQDENIGMGQPGEIDQRAFVPLGQVVPGIQHGPINQRTEMGLLKHLLQPGAKSRRVRRIIDRAGRALQQLMPCWMMGPQAVAQFLQPESIKFDLLVIDEASQVRPEDAIGSLARATQVVIVGDDKQMPPSSFGRATNASVSDDGDVDENEEVAVNLADLDCESVLGALSPKLCSVSLQWHYRSLHQSLIAFSNARCYGDKLIIPISRWHESANLGVKWQFVESGRFHQRRNQAEAELIVTNIEDHVRKQMLRPEQDRESLGVVAMNVPQRDLISDKWSELCRQDAELDGLREQFESSDSIFIRNLESVQGDERDVVMISVTYGRNADGEGPAQNFGPVNRAGGWRRLNVLVTRARKRVHVFSSMRSSDIRANEDELGELANADNGKSFFKQYLHFAETGRLPGASAGSTRDKPESHFEESVAYALESLGYGLHYQVGVSSFRIDIGVMHPNQDGEYLCGIECDGAAYHSHPNARDRDRIRQEILKKRGWRIHRIWSTDWYRNRQAEIERLRSQLQNWRDVSAS
jgi:hypothetical protein